MTTLVSSPLDGSLMRENTTGAPPMPGTYVRSWGSRGWCEVRVLDGPASGGKGSKSRNSLDCIGGKEREGPSRTRSSQLGIRNQG